MKTHEENTVAAQANRHGNTERGPTSAVADRSPPVLGMQHLQLMANGSPGAIQLRQLAAMASASTASNTIRHLRRTADSSAGTTQLKQLADANAETSIAPVASVQREKKRNHTGLPDELKAGVESLSGISMDHVKVHYNSDKPAQLQAHAYAHGSDIHLSPGQEKHLPHEAWHVVQQAQGRVRPTSQMKGGGWVNDDVDLEAEADSMGAAASPHRAETGLPAQDMLSTVPQILQRKVVRIGENNALPNSPVHGGAIVQRVFLDVGQDRGQLVQSQADVQALDAQDTLCWPSLEGQFNDDYSGSVRRAMEWGLRGGEGTAGWYGREYTPVNFHTIATAAELASNALAGIDAALDNEKNKTLVAIRAFRGANDGAMAGRTQGDLNTVLAAVNGQAAALHVAGLINDPAAVATAIEADPAEAHPNTLPTARISFGAAGTVYFKGRSAAVEDALVGTGPSAARALSSIGGNNADGASGTGMHAFLAPNPNSQIADDVGTEVAPALTPVSAMETAFSYLPARLGGADIPPRPQAVEAWLSSAKGALLASLTATTDLHPSNIVAGRSGKKHIIDAEFLLDVTQWTQYEQMLAGNAIANFDIASHVPSWLKTHMTTLSVGTKRQMADAVANGFLALGADKTHVWANIIAPIRTLIGTPALLRVIPLATDEFLRYVTNYHNAAGQLNKNNLVTQLWTDIVTNLNNIITVANPQAGHQELDGNLENGMVPLFHVRANDGSFLLNKTINIGATVVGRSVDDLLIHAGAAVSSRYADMAETIRKYIKT